MSVIACFLNNLFGSVCKALHENVRSLTTTVLGAALPVLCVTNEQVL
ncbi:MAG: hypothetical protein QOD84_2250, partial [Acidobacteriaceae bacterium]